MLDVIIDTLIDSVKLVAVFVFYISGDGIYRA